MSEKNTQNHQSEALDPKSSTTPSIRLLLVDDEEAYVNVLANRLRKRGLDVTKTCSGAQALQAMRHKEFDVVVLDLKMEDMDGIEVLKILKRMDPVMQVIMLTGHGSETAARQGIEYGAFDYLMKPCELDALVKKIHQASRNRSHSPKPESG